MHCLSSYEKPTADSAKIQLKYSGKYMFNISMFMGGTLWEVCYGRNLMGGTLREGPYGWYIMGGILWEIPNGMYLMGGTLW